MHHTGKWPQGFDFTGERAGVIGCGSTGVQVITDIVKRVKSLTCFQRHPQYSRPQRGWASEQGIQEVCQRAL